jgi:ABC-type transport system involved in cytochrome c biogenesis permease subunit
MRRVTPNVLRLASVPVGVVIGLWTASLNALGCYLARRLSSCAGPRRLPVFAGWECVVFGLGAAVVLVLAAEAVARLRSPS